MLTRDIISTISAIVVIFHAAFVMPGDFIIPTLAFLVALAWLFIHPRYEYVGKNRYLFNRINIFPLFAWTAAFVLSFQIYTFVFKGNFLLLSIFWVLGMITAEWIGYHVFKIRINKNHRGLLGFDVIHGSNSLKAFYLLSVPIFVLVAERVYIFLK